MYLRNSCNIDRNPFAIFQLRLKSVIYLNSVLTTLNAYSSPSIVLAFYNGNDG